MSDRASSSFTGTARALCRRSRCVFPARPLSPPTFCARHPQETAVSRRNSSTLRYGTLRGSVLGLEVVLPDGTIWDGLSIVAGFVLNVFRLRPEAASSARKAPSVSSPPSLSSVLADQRPRTSRSSRCHPTTQYQSSSRKQSVIWVKFCPRSSCLIGRATN